jgi:hypothetical protein
MVRKWQGQRTVLELSDGGLPTDAVGVLQNVTLSPTQEVSELRGAGDVRWVDIMRTSVGIDISGTVAAWDADTWDTLIDFDEAAGAFPSDADVPTFTTTTTLEASDGNTKEIVAKPGYMDPPPELSSEREDWVMMDLNIRCKEVTSITNP